MATLVTIIASVITGVIVGCWLTMVVATAAMSRSQQHMENKVRYWQARARRPVAAELPELEPAVPDYWPGA
jgi:outer membrane lipoprotein SlyB